MNQTEISQKLKISQAAVSLVLNDPNTSRVSFEKRNLILSLLKKNGYCNQRQRKKTWNLVFAEDASLKSNYNGLQQALAGADEIAEKFKYDIFTESFSGSSLKFVARNKVDGIVLKSSSTQLNLPEIAKGLPLVLFNFAERILRYDTVTADNVDTMQQALSHLINLGHRNIAYLSADTPRYRKAYFSNYEERLSGFRQTRKLFDLPQDEDLISNEMVADASYDCTVRVFTRVLENWLRRPVPPTAVVCCNDYYASVLYQIATCKGLQIPRQLSIVGIDNLDHNPFFKTFLTSVDQNFLQMGREAASLLIRRIQQPKIPVCRILCKGELKVKASTAVCPAERQKTIPRIFVRQS